MIRPSCDHNLRESKAAELTRRWCGLQELGRGVSGKPLLRFSSSFEHYLLPSQTSHTNLTCVAVLCKGCCCIMCGVLIWPVPIPLGVWFAWTTWPGMFMGVSCCTLEAFPEASCTEPKLSPEADCCKNILRKKQNKMQKIHKSGVKEQLFVAQGASAEAKPPSFNPLEGKAPAEGIRGAAATRSRMPNCHRGSSVRLCCS